MKKILIISPYFPFPARDGGKVRLYNLIKHLSYNNEIYLLAYIEPNANKNCIELAKEFCTEVFPVLREEDKRIVKDDIPRCVSFFYTQKMIDELKKVLRIIKPDIIQLDFLIMTQYVKYIKNIPVFYTEHDMSVLDFNQSFHDRDLKDKDRFFEWKKLISYEKHILDYFNSVIVLTDRDKSLIENLNANIKATIIPTGVDTEFYKPTVYSADEKKNLVFVGHYKHFPNADAIMYFVQNIYSKIVEKKPDINLYIVGSGVTKPIENLQNKNVIVTGELEDIRKYLRKPNIFVAPVRLGGGIKGKVLEAMAMGVPIVATKEAISGIDYANNNFALVSDNVDCFANNVIKLVENDKLYTELSNNARKIVEQYYNWTNIAQKLNNFYSSKSNKI